MQLFLPERAAANANAHETRKAMNAKMCLHYLIQYHLLMPERKAARNYNNYKVLPFSLTGFVDPGM